MDALTSFFAWRYFRSKRSTNAINIISWISVVAMAVVTAALVVVLSVFNGFEDLVKSLYADFYTDISIAPARGKWINDANAVLARVRAEAAVQQAEPVLTERAILVESEDKSIAWLKGVPTSYARMSGVPAHIGRGQFALGTAEEPALVLGGGVENSLQILAGQHLMPITVYLPNRTATDLSDPLSALLSANAFAAGSFSIQQEFDNQYAFTSIEFLRYMLDLPVGAASAVEVATKPGTDVEALARRLQQQLGSSVVVKTRYQQNQALFAAMQMERVIIFSVAVLILLIAAFNIISSLSMTVLEKEKDIAVLQAMGMAPQRVALIYLKLAALLAGVGAGAGLLLGLLVCLGQRQFHWVKLGGNSFIIDYYPVAIRWTDLGLVACIIAAIALLAGWLPARRAASIHFSLRTAGR